MEILNLVLEYAPQGALGVILLGVVAVLLGGAGARWTPRKVRPPPRPDTRKLDRQIDQGRRDIVDADQRAAVDRDRVQQGVDDGQGLADEVKRRMDRRPGRPR